MCSWFVDAGHMWQHILTADLCFISFIHQKISWRSLDGGRDWLYWALYWFDGTLLSGLGQVYLKKKEKKKIQGPPLELSWGGNSAESSSVADFLFQPTGTKCNLCHKIHNFDTSILYVLTWSVHLWFIALSVILAVETNTSLWGLSAGWEECCRRSASPSQTQPSAVIGRLAPGTVMQSGWQPVLSQLCSQSSHLTS